MGKSFQIFLMIAVALLTGGIAAGQSYDSIRLAELPKLEMPAGLKSGGLPYKVDNSRNKHFPAIFTQYGYSCNQAASISIGFTYELNAIRNQDALLDSNRLPVFFTWNMMNMGNSETGVSYFESWDMVDAIGCPSWADYGSYLINESRWMDGYYKYYRGMQNRVEEYYSIDVSNPEGLQTLKHWLFDHVGQYQPGGVANFQLATLDLQFWPLPEGTEDAGKMMIPWFGYAVGHAMTFTGYNDSVRFDFNRDGKYTNNLDTNGDGQVDMADWEIGALICVNTYGTEWGTEGRAYVPYRILPLTPEKGGIWQKSVVVAKPRKTYNPKLTLKARIRYHSRKKLWITAGVSQDPAATEPEHILDQPVFHYQGGDLPMLGLGSSDPDLIEIGIDATPLLGFIESGKPAAFFLVVCEQDPAASTEGAVEYYSFNEYRPAETEHPGGSQVPVNSPFTAVPVVFTPQFDGPSPAAGRLPGATAGQLYSTQLNAAGGTPPYKWSLASNIFFEQKFETQFPTTFQTRILPDGANFDKKSVTLPFDFPYRGKVYREMTLSSKGGILFEENNLYIPYGIELRELLGLNKAIFPFYSTDFQYIDYLDGVYYLPHSNEATIYWNATIRLNYEISDVNFAARLHPDGTIEFFYGAFANSITTPWLIGLTGGSKAQSYYPDINARGVHAGLNIRFSPPLLPADLHITGDGQLSCRPLVPGKTWTIPVRLEDAGGMKKYCELTLPTDPLSTGSTGLPEPTVRVYPNPATDRFFVQVESVTDGEAGMKVFDLTGKEIYQRVYNIRAGSSVFTVELNKGTAPGVYIIEMNGITVYRSKIYVKTPAD